MNASVLIKWQGYGICVMKAILQLSIDCTIALSMRKQHHTNTNKLNATNEISNFKF